MKRSLFYIIGNLLVSFAVATLIYAGVGTGAWDALFVGLSLTLGWTVGTWVFLVGAIIIFVNALLLKKKPDLTAFLTIFLVGVGIDLFLNVVYSAGQAASLGTQWGFFVLGLLLLPLGIVMYIQADFAKNPIDQLMLSLHQRFGWSLRISRTVGEVIAFFLALLFGGPVKMGTLVVALGVGPLIQLYFSSMKRWYEKNGNV